LGEGGGGGYLLILSFPLCRQVRRQTCDLISLLEMAEPLSHYYMFLEDDFR